MTRKSKKAAKDDVTRVRRKAIPWESDGVSPGSPSSFDVLMMWLGTLGNAERWRREKRKDLVKEIIQMLAANGILHRAVGDVHSKIWYMETQFTSANAFLTRKGQLDAFQRGEAGPDIANEVLKLCPHYQDMAPFFGKLKAGKKVQVTPKIASNGAAAVNGAKTVSDTVSAGGSVSAAGEWKRSLEKDRRDTVTDKSHSSDRGEKVVNVSNGANGDEASKQQQQKKEKLTAKKKEIGGDTTGTKKANGVDAVTRKNINDVARNKKKSSADGKNGAAEAGSNEAEKDKLSGADEQKIDDDVKQHGEGALADVEDGQSDIGEDEQNDGDEDTDTFSEQGEAQADDDSESQSSDEAEKPRARITVRSGVRSPFKTKPQQIESESSSSEEEDDEDEKNDVESGHEEGDGEEQIPLAQTDEVDPSPVAEEGDEVEQDGEEKEHSEVDEADQSKAEELEDTEEEEEVEEDPTEDRSNTTAADSTNNSDSSSSSESEDAESEEETPPTQVKINSDAEVESGEDESKAEDNEDDVEMLKDFDKRDSDAHAPVAEVEPAVVSSERKRSVQDLERAAFVERAKQEQDQRDELFKLERAKLECELQAKQVQLTMERSLARKKLLGAGIDRAEVDRVLPLN
ncbi:hypothetical protein PInf_016324 [Phytophthora infestans]|nr:hypothetical protein PInf_016324 [Phytophthora infestans]